VIVITLPSRNAREASRGNALDFHPAASTLCAQAMPRDDLASGSKFEVDRQECESLNGLFLGRREPSESLAAAVDALLRPN
jgi:hypothetical protein